MTEQTSSEPGKYGESFYKNTPDQICVKMVVYAVGILADAGIKIADLKTKLQEAAEKEIKPHCK